MNYQKIYDAIIANRKANKYDGYTELHHILPKSLGGSNLPDNLVRLSAREHFICHVLLYKIHRNASMAYAMNAMTINICDGKRYTSHMFKYAKETFSSYVSDQQKERFKDLKVVEKLRQASKAYWATDEAKDNARKRRLGVTTSDATKQKLREANLGKTQTQDTINKRSKKLSELFKGKPKSSEKELEIFKYGRMGNGNPRAVPLDIYNYKTKQLVASNITATEFGRLHGIPKNTIKHLTETAVGKAKQCKGYYAKHAIKDTT